MARLSLTRRIGLTLVLLGILWFMGCVWWTSDYSWQPVDVPISLAQGHFRTAPFHIDVPGVYEIRILVERNLAASSGPCFVANHQCQGHSALTMSWSVSDQRQTIAQARGDTDTDFRFLWGGTKVNRNLGRFEAGAGEYTLELEVYQDGSYLDAGHPRLVVEEDGQSPVHDEVAGFSVISPVLFIAGILFSIGPAPSRRRNKTSEYSLTQPPGDIRIGPQLSPVWIGVPLLVMGIGLYAWYCQWFDSRTFAALDMPVSLARGHIRSGPFPINLRDAYEVSLRMDALPNNPSCVEDSVLKTRWALWRDGILAARSVDPLSGRYLDRFDSEEGIYSLDLEVLNDASCLNSGNPRLTVSTNEYYYDYSNLLGWFCLMCVGVGTSLLLIAGSQSYRFLPSVTPCEPPKMCRGSIRRRAKLPKGRYLSGPPSFGLVASTILVWVLMLLVLIQPALRGISYGLPVGLLRTETRTQTNTGLQPVVVRMEGGMKLDLNLKPDLYVDSEAVSWDDFESVLRKQIARRPPNWPVYLEGDHEMTWTWPAKIIDRIRGLHPEVVLLTGRDESSAERVSKAR